MDVLDKIVNLILQDPFLTAAEIARRLGYAEEKTIYYWIEKAHYPGLVAFKRAVLAGQYRPSSASARENAPHYGTIPIISGFSREGTALVTNSRYRASVPSSDVRFAWQYQGPNDWIVMAGDWLLLSLVELTHAPLKAWCLAFDKEGSPVVRVLLPSASGEPPRLVVPQSYETDATSVPRYLIRHLFRTLE